MTQTTDLADHLFSMGNTHGDHMNSDETASGIIADPQAHIDALVDAGVLWVSRSRPGHYSVLPPACPTCGRR